MSKQDFIPTINELIGEAGVPLPQSFEQSQQEFNGVTSANYQAWLTWINRVLLLFKANDAFYIFPEGALPTIRDGLQNLINNNPAFAANPSAIFPILVAQLEQLTQSLSSYVSMIDRIAYQELTDQITVQRSDFSDFIKTSKQDEDSSKKRIDAISQTAERLLGKVSAGVLSEKFQYLADQGWQSIITFASGVLAFFSITMLIIKSNEVIRYVVAENGNVKTSVIFAKLTVSLPYLAVLFFSAVELRRRITLRDQLYFKKEVAAALDGYTELLIAKTNDIQNETAQDRARQKVIDFLSAAILELTKTPDGKSNGTRLGAKFKDVGFEVEQ